MLTGLCRGDRTGTATLTQDTKHAQFVQSADLCTWKQRLTGTATMIAGGTAETVSSHRRYPDGKKTAGAPSRGPQGGPLTTRPCRQPSRHSRQICAQSRRKTERPSASSLISTERQPRLWSRGSRPASEYPIGSTQNSHEHMHHHQH
jgi:hypothetical protein